MKIKIKSNAIALVILFSLLVLPSAHAADDIAITYMHEGPPYWYGKGMKHDRKNYKNYLN